MSISSKDLPGELDIGPPSGATRFHYFYRLHVKRMADCLVAFTALVACLPVLLISSALIVLETPGSPIFKQRRVGIGGQPFNILKLRTMYDGADSKGFCTKPEDSRVTRLGKILRTTKIDEIPQLINVLRGDMSLIGPRPLSVDECDYITGSLGYSTTHPGFHPAVRPGITGMEQIYRIHPSVYAHRFEWNANYERNLSLLLDLKIFVTTMIMCNLVCVATVIGGILEIVWLSKTFIFH